MILYFTGSGNSYQLAKTIAGITGDTVVSINQRLKNFDTSELHSDKPFTFVTPIYCGRIPRVVADHIRRTSFTGSNEVYFACACAQNPYKARHYVEKLCAEKGWRLKGFDHVIMPQCYVAMFEPPAPSEAHRIISAARPRMYAIGEAIRDGQPLSVPTKGGGMMSDVINPFFYKTTINAKGFHVTEACIGCGTCTNACPLDNIKLVGGRPAWGDTCTHCMACINSCPQRAIQFKDNTAERNRYWNPEYPKPANEN